MFSKEISKICAYCEHSKMLASGRAVICNKKKELLAPNGVCSSYRYDPLKRAPAAKNG